MTVSSQNPLRVFITGGTRGIGRAIALRFAREGAMVAIAARTSADLDEVVSEIEAAGGQGDACQTNMRDHGSVEAAVFRAVDFFEGTTDIVVNCAGLVEFKPFDELGVDDWERALAVHLTGPFLVLAEVLPSLRESDRGHVFNIGAHLAGQPGPGQSLMAASKAGVEGMSRGLRADLEPEGIRVTTVLPGFVETPGLAPWKGALEGAAVTTPEAVADAIWEAYQAEAAPDEISVR
ncbi:MAG: SDR family NAD(P)-dependent oxidoreductase [Planctomycetota bacterium]|nr:SDR family NAD(P)-dependent oxidoreductase [Planctomycetota bacterium]MDG1984132.1 SDR family NAD(P)-dependent oxidoreductase [Planctomycetota bacterium]